MAAWLRLSDGRIFISAALVLCAVATRAPAQISTDIIEKYRAELQQQAAAPELNIFRLAVLAARLSF